MYFLKNKFFAVLLLLIFGVMMGAPLLLTVVPNFAGSCGMGCLGVCCCMAEPAAAKCATDDSSTLLPRWVSCTPVKISPVVIVSADFFLPPHLTADLPLFYEASFFPFYPPRFTPIVLPPSEPPPWLC